MNWFKTDDVRIQDIEPLISPAILIKDYPATTEIAKMVATTRKNAENIISGHDDRLLVVVGPCSIHDPQAAVDYASRLNRAAGSGPGAARQRSPAMGASRPHRRRPAGRAGSERAAAGQLQDQIN